MAENVPDPDYVMEPDLNDDQMVADEPDEPIDDYYGDAMNANQEFELNDRESTPVPEEAVPKKPDLCNFTDNKPDESFIVNTPAIDLDVLIQNYSGPSLFERLQYVIDHCPPLEKDATIHLINSIRKDSMNVPRYMQLFANYEKMEGITSNVDPPIPDQEWVDTTHTTSAARLDLLLTDYKKQKDEGVKEATRRAMFELFQHYKITGNYTDCLRLYARGMREYCSQFKHMILMYLQWLEVIIYSNEWARVDPLISNAERSISDADDADQRDKSSAARATVQGFKSNRHLISSARTKIDAINGLSKIVSGKYRLAAEKLIKVDVDLLDLPWLLHSSDIAHYATLTVLASFERTDIKKKVLSDAICRKFLEAEPQLVELLQNFVGSRFGLVFDTLASLRDKLLLDPYLADHVDCLFKIIRERALVQYFYPFSSASIKEVSIAFRTTEHLIESEIVKLIEQDTLLAKIDSVGGVVRMHQPDPRQDTYRKIIESCETLIERAEISLFRSLIYQTRMTPPSEPRNKRKGGFGIDEGSEPGHAVNRPKMPQSLQGAFKAFRGGKQQLPSEADSSEGSNEDAREGEH